MLTQSQIIDLYWNTMVSEDIRAKKIVTIKAIQSNGGEVIDTYVKGVLETSNVTEPGDWIITNPKGERYINKPNEFKKRYFHVKDDIYKSLGVEVYTLELTEDNLPEGGQFMAPWNSPMICEVGDYLLMPVETSKSNPEIYRIEREMFNETYMFV